MDTQAADSGPILSFLGYVVEGKEDEEEAVQGVRIKFKGKCSKIKIVNEMIVQRGGVRWWKPSPW